MQRPHAGRHCAIGKAGEAGRKMQVWNLVRSARSAVVNRVSLIDLGRHGPRSRTLHVLDVSPVLSRAGRLLQMIGAAEKVIATDNGCLLRQPRGVR